MPFLCSIFLCPTSKLQRARGEQWVQPAPLPTRAGRDLDLGGLCLGRLFRVMPACKMCRCKAPLEIKLCTPSHLIRGFCLLSIFGGDCCEPWGGKGPPFQQDCPEWLCPLTPWLSHRTLFSLQTTEKSKCPKREGPFKAKFLKDKE